MTTAPASAVESSPTIDATLLPRLAFDELSAPLQAALGAKVERLGYLGEFFAVAGHEPAALAAFVELTESLGEALPARWHHLIALTIATELGNDYERCQHEQRCVVLGLPIAWVQAAEGRDGPASACLDADERVLQQLAWAAVARDHATARARLQELLAGHPPRVAMAAMLMIGRYVAHASVTLTVGITSPVPSIFEGDGDG